MGELDSRFRRNEIKRAKNNIPVISIFIFLLCSCSAKHDNIPPKLPLPANWNYYSLAQKDNMPQQWWLQFNDPILNELIKESLVGNSDIELAMSNVLAAKAQLNLVNSYRFPQINLQGGANRTKNSKETKAPNEPKFSNNFGLASVLNYELDLWGAAANASESAKKTFLVSEYSKAAVRLSVISNVTISYFNLLTLDKQIYLTEKLIEAQTEIYKLNQKSYNLGVGDLISVSEAASELALTNLSLPPLKQQRHEQETALKILVGRTPENIVNGLIYRDKPIDYFPALPVLPKILPSELLEQRPDIKAAEQNLLAADANLKAIKATYFPQISLTDLLGFGSNKLNTLFINSAETWQVGGNIAGPIFDFGKTRANVQIAESVKEQYIVQYKSVVRTAFGEVMDALSAGQTSSNNFHIWQQNEAALMSIFKLADQRYKRGNIDYLTVLTAKQNVLQNEIDGVAIKLSQLSSMVNIFHALGGEW
ncbi:efflux transporter outer membrane subunit [Rickettsia tamurae]|uniref:efflux transporter outer membrane subunit n=1 Tax=Rickettsia tamurae TaxID=334545 RepID=UPI000B171E78|nr:TolC family protein [Rickettsia tamurae]